LRVIIGLQQRFDVRRGRADGPHNQLVIVMSGNIALGLILISALRLLGLLRELDEWAQPGVRTR